MNARSGALRFLLLLAGSLSPPFLLAYATRFRDTYLLGAGALLWLVLFACLIYLSPRGADQPEPGSGRNPFPGWLSLLSLFGVLLASAAVFLERDVYVRLYAEVSPYGGLPLAASQFLLFVSAFLYCAGDPRTVHPAFFSGRIGQTIGLSALLVIACSYISIILYRSQRFYLSMLSASFLIAAGGYLSNVLRRKGGGDRLKTASAIKGAVSATSKFTYNFLNKIAKLTFYRIKYGRREGYDHEAYWRDRFQKHGMSLRGAGHEGKSEEENREQYEESLRELQTVMAKAGIGFTDKKILEVGVGTGFYLSHFVKEASYYCALDVTDALFPKLLRLYPQAHFLKADICKDAIEGKYDLIMMIEVLEHIVTKDGLRGAFDNIKRCLAPGGHFILGPVGVKSKKKLFYLHFWSCDDVMAHFESYKVAKHGPFRGGTLMIISPPSHQEG
jgi:SAM-dependent methyltransferase